ncbi:MAG: glycerophosphodiester phosphodiesterase [Dechloromonas sp.]|nr:glycerophosphodiester phosphodiesterase [Dechloromonas sp.]
MRLPLPRWFAHRGGGLLAPENTLAGIRLAAHMGFSAVEFDVMLSADGTPVLIHDDTLERTTNGQGAVAEIDDARLFALDAGGGQRIPRLDEAAWLCRQLGLLANVEIKPSPGMDRQTAQVVCEQVGRLWHGAAIQPLISSFSLAAMAVVQEVLPQARRGVLFEVVPSDWLAILQRLGAQSLHCDADTLSKSVLRDAVDRDIPVLCYTVNDLAQAESLLADGVSSLFTDRLDLFAPGRGR